MPTWKAGRVLLIDKKAKIVTQTYLEGFSAKRKMLSDFIKIILTVNNIEHLKESPR